MEEGWGGREEGGGREGGREEGGGGREEEREEGVGFFRRIIVDFDFLEERSEDCSLASFSSFFERK